MWFLYKEDLCGRPRYIKNTGPKVELTDNIYEAHLFDIPAIRALLVIGGIYLKDNWNTMSYSSEQTEKLTYAFMIENDVACMDATISHQFVAQDNVVSFFRTVWSGQNA